MRRLLIVTLASLAALASSPPASADHTGPRCDVPSVTHSTDNGAHVMVCYPDGRVGAGTFTNGPTYVLWDPASHVVTAAHGYALIYVDGNGASVCSVSGTWNPGDPKPNPGPGGPSGSCRP